MKSALYLITIAVAFAATGAVESDAAARSAARRVAKYNAPASRNIANHTPTSYRRTGPGSFMPYKADSIQEIVDQLRNNKAVAARYARHFDTTPEAVTQYFLQNLKLVVLDKPQTRTTYFVTKGGEILFRTCIIPKGTRVFATSDGQAILEWRCGNPLTRKLPLRAQPVKVKAKLEPEVKVAPFEQEIGVFPPILTPEIMALATTPVTMVPTLEPMIETTGSFPMIFPPVLAAAVPMLLGAVSVQNSQSPPPVPEPSAILLALGVGFPSAMMMRRVRNRGK